MWEATPEQARGTCFFAFVHSALPNTNLIFEISNLHINSFLSTGKGISFVVEEVFQESLGMRPDAAHVLVLITDGKAQDNVVPPSRIARALGLLSFFF